MEIVEVWQCLQWKYYQIKRFFEFSVARSELGGQRRE
jgi:hypothetical protein